MRDDLPTRLREAAAEPSHTPDFDALATRGHRQHLAARVGTALVAVVALVAGGVVLYPDGQPAGGPVIGEPPSRPDKTASAVTLPDGWHEIAVGGAVFGVPGDWLIEEFREPAPLCVNGIEQPSAVVMHAGPAPEHICTAQGMSSRVLEAAPLSQMPESRLAPPAGQQWRPTAAGSQSGDLLRHDDRGTVVAYRFPTLDLWLQFSGPEPIAPWAEQILTTITTAAEDRGPQASCPDGEADAIIRWASFVKIGQRTMTEVVDAEPIARDQLGELLLETRCQIADEASKDYEPKSGDAAFLPPGTPVYAIDGVDAHLRVVADDDGELRVFQVRTADNADTADGPTASLATPRPVPDDPDPAARAGAASRHVKCNGTLAQGGWAPDFGAPSGATDPRQALDDFVADGPFDLPTSGYDRAAAEPGRVLFTHTVNGDSKVAVIVADSTVVESDPSAQPGWGVETFATCDPAEYAPNTDEELHRSVWTDRDGDRVPTSTLTTFSGPAHCDWQSITFMSLDDQQYLRDPEHLLTSDTVVPYDGDAELPADAIDTGYRRGNDQLWLAADRSIVYLVTPDEVEAWPSTTEPVGCA